MPSWSPCMDAIILLLCRSTLLTDLNCYLFSLEYDNTRPSVFETRPIEQFQPLGVPAWHPAVCCPVDDESAPWIQLWRRLTCSCHDSKNWINNKKPFFCFFLFSGPWSRYVCCCQTESLWTHAGPLFSPMKLSAERRNYYLPRLSCFHGLFCVSVPGQILSAAVPTLSE